MFSGQKLHVPVLQLTSHNIMSMHENRTIHPQNHETGIIIHDHLTYFLLAEIFLNKRSKFVLLTCSRSNILLRFYARKSHNPPAKPRNWDHLTYFYSTRGRKSEVARLHERSKIVLRGRSSCYDGFVAFSECAVDLPREVFPKLRSNRDCLRTQSETPNKKCFLFG